MATPITLDILHAQCDRLQNALHVQQVWADRILAGDCSHFWIAVSGAPAVRYTVVEQIDAVVAAAADEAALSAQFAKGGW